MHLTWQRPGGGGVRSGERGQQCGKKAAARAALKGEELEVAARLWRAGSWRRQQLWRAGSWIHGGGSATPEGGEEAAARLRRAGRRRQRGYGGRGVGCSAVLKGGEEAVTAKRHVRCLKIRSCPQIARAALGPRECIYIGSGI